MVDVVEKNSAYDLHNIASWIKKYLTERQFQKENILVDFEKNSQHSQATSADIDYASKTQQNDRRSMAPHKSSGQRS